MIYQIFDNIQECTDDEVARLLPLVSSQRREQALRFKLAMGRYACLKSYLMLREILLDLRAIADDEPLIFDYGEHGKPFLKNHPDIHFNISHCPSAIAVAVSDNPVGIDIERFHTPDEALLQRTMNPDERQVILSSDNPAETFTALWTQKEAILKCRGTGIIDDLRWVLTTDYCGDARPCVSTGNPSDVMRILCRDARPCVSTGNPSDVMRILYRDARPCVSTGNPSDVMRILCRDARPCVSPTSLLTNINQEKQYVWSLCENILEKQMSFQK